MVKPIGDNINNNDTMIKMMLNKCDDQSFIGGHDCLAKYGVKLLRSFENMNCSPDLKAKLKDRVTVLEKRAKEFNTPLARLQRAEERLRHAKNSMSEGYDSTKYWGNPNKQSAYNENRRYCERELRQARAEYNEAVADYNASLE